MGVDELLTRIVVVLPHPVAFTMDISLHATYFHLFSTLFTLLFHTTATTTNALLLL